MQNNYYKGFSMFNDVEDKQLQTYNRARVLVNMSEDHTNKKTQRINAVGVSLVLGYFGQLPYKDRDVVKEEYAKQMQNSGFKLSQPSV